MQLKKLILNVTFYQSIVSQHPLIGGSLNLSTYSHKHKARDHHRIQTQIVHREWVITFLKKYK